MDEAIFKTVLNFGVFPSVTIYLVIIIMKDFRKDLADLKKDSVKHYKQILEKQTEIEKSMKELVQINEQMQNYITHYLNNLMIKLLDVLEDMDK